MKFKKTAIIVIDKQPNQKSETNRCPSPLSHEVHDTNTDNVPPPHSEPVRLDENKTYKPKKELFQQYTERKYNVTTEPTNTNRHTKQNAIDNEQKNPNDFLWL